MWTRRLAVAAAAATYLLLLTGSLVTNTGSATGCGSSWPLCGGRFVPLPLPNWHTLIEFGHRVSTSLVSVLILALAVVAWRSYGQHRYVRWMVVSSLFFLFLQAALGAFAVVLHEPVALLAAHFGVSLASFASVTLLAVMVGELQDGYVAPPASAATRRWAIGLALYTLVVVYLGAYVRHSGAAFACSGWPLCNGQLVPAFGPGVFAQWIHRLAALLLVVAVGAAVHVVRKHDPARSDLRASLRWASLLVVLQALSGWYILASGMSVLSTMLHAGIMPLLFMALIYLVWQVWPGRVASSLAKVTAPR